MSTLEFFARAGLAPLAVVVILYVGVELAWLMAGLRHTDYTAEVRKRMEAGEPLWHIEQDLDLRDNRRA